MWLRWTTLLFYKGTIVRCKLDEDDNDYCVRFIAGNRVGYLCPDKFKEFSPYSGWGTYEDLCEFVLEYILTIHKYPDAIIKACR